MFATPSSAVTALPIFQNRLRHLPWLGVYGVNSQLSDNGYSPKSVDTLITDGVPLNLIEGRNGNVLVYSFVAKNNPVRSYKGDLAPFYRYSQANLGLTGGHYLQMLQAGTEAFTGHGVRTVTSGYSSKLSSALTAIRDMMLELKGNNRG